MVVSDSRWACSTLLAGSVARFAVLAAVAAAFVSCGSRQQQAEVASVRAASISGTLRPLAAAMLGDPIPGLTPAELASFQRGKAVFDKRFTPEEGLGPLYNATSCASCHSRPTSGGSAELYRNFYVAMFGFGPPFQSVFLGLPSPVIPAFGVHDMAGARTFSLQGGRFVLPQIYFGIPVIMSQRNAIPIFGTGLFEFVSNATILSRSDPFDADQDGISGRPNFDFGDLGRFGVKAQSNNIERFTRPPLNNQMGITSDPILGTAGAVTLASAAQGTGDPDSRITDLDSTPDPEISPADLGDLMAFARFLAPPDRLPFNAHAEAGEAVFERLKCTSCHVPSLPSSLGPVEAYTDLLLHDMGPGLADNLQFGDPSSGGMATGPLSTGTEFRTQPLWGVNLHAPFLHDGRAGSLFEAISEHGGEAQVSRDSFLALTGEEQSAVISFLEHL